MPPIDIGAQLRTASHLLSVVHATEGAEKMPPSEIDCLLSRVILSIRDGGAIGTFKAAPLQGRLFETGRRNLASKRHVGFIEADFSWPSTTPTPEAPIKAGSKSRST